MKSMLDKSVDFARGLIDWQRPCPKMLLTLLVFAFCIPSFREVERVTDIGPELIYVLRDKLTPQARVLLIGAHVLAFVTAVSGIAALVAGVVADVKRYRIVGDPGLSYMRQLGSKVLLYFGFGLIGVPTEWDPYMAMFVLWGLVSIASAVICVFTEQPPARVAGTND